MKARFVSEAVNFQRGKDPKNAMGIGDRVQRAIGMIRKRIEEVNLNKKKEFRWEEFEYGDGEIEWSKESAYDRAEIIRYLPNYHEIYYLDGFVPVRITIFDEIPQAYTRSYYHKNNDLPFEERMKIITNRI